MFHSWFTRRMLDKIRWKQQKVKKTKQDYVEAKAAATIQGLARAVHARREIRHTVAKAYAKKVSVDSFKPIKLELEGLSQQSFSLCVSSSGCRC